MPTPGQAPEPENRCWSTTPSRRSSPETAERLEEERRVLYTEVYDELLKRIRHHPLLQGRRTPEDVQRMVDEQLAKLAPYISRNTVFLEVGASGCALSTAMAQRVNQVIAVDVSNEITAHVQPPRTSSSSSPTARASPCRREASTSRTATS